MKKRLLIIFLVIANLSFAQSFVDKSFYLIDSLSQNKLSSLNQELLDSLLKAFHASESDLSKAEILTEISSSIKDDNIWPKYTDLKLKFCFNRMFSSKRVEKEKNGLKLHFSKGVNELGQLEIDKGNHLKSLDYFYTAIELLNGIGKAEDYCRVYSNIGTNYFYQGDIEQAEFFLNRAMDSLYDSRDMVLRALALNNLAVIYQEKEEYDKSLIYHFQSLDLALSENNSVGAAMSYNNIGGIYSSQYEDSVTVGIDYLKIALVAFKEAGMDDWVAMTYDKIALSNLRLSQFKKAEINANFSLFYATQSKSTQAILRAYRTLFKVKKYNSKNGEALEFYQKYIHIKDSLYSSSVRLESAAKELEYKYKSDKEISEKEHEKVLAISEEASKKQEVINYAILFIVIIVILFVIVQRRKIKHIKTQSEVIESQSEERKILLKEIHHRVKNNFQIVCSVLRLQSHEENSPIIDKAFEDAINRVQSMAEVHELIYKEESFANINPQIYFERLTNSIKHFSYEKEIDYVIEANVDSLKMEMMIALGMATNELITNSIKHAFNEKTEHPAIKITMELEKNEILFVYRDNGEGFDTMARATSFGTELIETVIDQIDGTVSYNENNKGVFATIRFNIN